MLTYQHPTAWTPVLVHEGSPRVPSAWILIHPANLLRLRPQHLEVLVSLHGDPEVDPLQHFALLCCPSLALLLNHEPANCGVMRWKWASPAPTCCNCWHTLIICSLATKVQGNKFISIGDNFLWTSCWDQCNSLQAIDIIHVVYTMHKNKGPNVVHCNYHKGL